MPSMHLSGLSKVLQTQAPSELFPAGALQHLHTPLSATTPNPSISVLNSTWRQRLQTSLPAKQLAHNMLTDMEQLCGSIHPLQQENLQKIANGSGVVVTGQQPMLLGGPLLIVFKALTAIHEAQLLTQSGVPCVPVFWLAGDDDDLTECNYLENPYYSVAHSSLMLDFERVPGQSMVSYVLTPHHAEQVQAMLSAMPVSTQTARILQECYAPGVSLLGAFAQFMHRVLGPSGLLFVSGASNWVREQAQPLLQQLVNDHGAVLASLQQRASDLQTQGIAVQVNVQQPLRVFKWQNGIRSRLNPAEVQKVLKTQNHPTYTHDVLSRPLVCDRILPIIGHVLGPAELAYFALLAPLYDYTHMPFPFLAPRYHGWVHKRSYLQKLQLHTTSQISDFREQQVALQSIRSRLVPPDGFLEGQAHWESIMAPNVPIAPNATAFKEQSTPALPPLSPKSHKKWVQLLQKTQRQFTKQVQHIFWQNQLEQYGSLPNDIFGWYGKNRKQERYVPFFCILHNGTLPEDWLHSEFFTTHDSFIDQ
jgi:hypothetical protein